jgi:hypothetical protein
MNSEQVLRADGKIKSDAASGAAHVLYGDLKSAKVNADHERQQQYSELGTPCETFVGSSARDISSLPCLVLVAAMWGFSGLVSGSAGRSAICCCVGNI